MLSTVVMATAAAAVLALGTQDARLLRLGVVAALWAAMVAAFTTARARHEVSSRAEHADQLRTVYQLELGREVAARREHALTVERELRKQVELSQRREIVELRAELSALGVNLAQLLGGNSLVERVTLQAESTRLLPLPAHPRKFDDSNNGAPVATTAATPSAAVTVGPTGPESRFGPSRRETPSSNGQGRHGAPNRERSGSHNNGTGSHYNGTGSHNNGGGAARSPAAPAQRSVQDLLAAHGAASTPRRRRTREDGPATRA
jgi:hypothetical protein